MKWFWKAAVFLALVGSSLAQTRPFEDQRHMSKVFGGERNYRLFLPKGYESSTKRYPVIYYFHGHSDRYTLERYDEGKDTVPKIAQFTAENDVIVVSVDGFVARAYTGFYGGDPWDVREDGGDYDFGLYFKELVEHIDSNFRTLTDRRHRATSGLSMGGFASLWISARFPDLIGSASSFNPGPEFFVGDKGTRMLWRPKDHVHNHQYTMVRLIRASGDFISQYHEETKDAYAPSSVPFEYRLDEYHRHWATSIGETFAFHMRAFDDSALDNVPEKWSYSSPYRQFTVWGYVVEATGSGKAMLYLENVTQCGMRVRTRKWAPDGPAGDRNIRIRTAPLYEPGARYTLLSRGLSDTTTRKSELTAGSDGRLEITLDGSGYQLGLSGPGCGAEPPVLLPLTSADILRVSPGKQAHLPLRIFNPRNEVQKGVRLILNSEYPTVEISKREVSIPELGPGEVKEVGALLPLKFTAGAGDYARVGFSATIGFDDWHSTRESFSVLVEPEGIPKPVEYEVLDGRTKTFTMFRQKGNQGGGSAVEKTVTEGTGNGNGILEPGETATIWVKIPQGLDPFDKGNWHRAKVRAEENLIEEVEDIQEEKQREWTGAKERTSVIRWRAGAPKGQSARLVLDVESWSFHYTPDVRYGVERLYQAIQLHKHHLYELVLRVP
jgi:pimeloyl-ACP methyl ester carboxylesterase